jgi:hypothetical protein
VNVKTSLMMQLQHSLDCLQVPSELSQFNEMSIMEIDYATETLRAWKRVCEGTSPAAVRSVQYWGSLYCAVRINSGTDPDADLATNPSTESDGLYSDAG